MDIPDTPYDCGHPLIHLKVPPPPLVLMNSFSCWPRWHRAVRNDLTVEQHSRESIRIARIARELLKKFAAAFRLFQDMNEEGKLKAFEITRFI